VGSTKACEHCTATAAPAATDSTVNGFAAVSARRVCSPSPAIVVLFFSLRRSVSGSGSLRRVLLRAKRRSTYDAAGRIARAEHGTPRQIRIWGRYRLSGDVQDSVPTREGPHWGQCAEGETQRLPIAFANWNKISPQALFISGSEWPTSYREDAQRGHRVRPRRTMRTPPTRRSLSVV
jgi:hypothetical protein